MTPPEFILKSPFLFAALILLGASWTGNLYALFALKRYDWRIAIPLFVIPVLMVFLATLRWLLYLTHFYRAAVDEEYFPEMEESYKKVEEITNGGAYLCLAAIGMLVTSTVCVMACWSRLRRNFERLSAK